MKFLIIITFFLLLFTFNSLAQDEINFKNTENGFFWLSLQSPIPYQNSKRDFLSSMLEKYSILRIAQNKDYLIDCRDELSRLQSEEESHLISVDIIVKKIDEFYTSKENFRVPIINAYCYSIKEIAGASKEELIKYKNEIMVRCVD